MACLSYREHHRSRRTSLLLNSYLVFFTVLNIVRTRTAWLIYGKKAYSILFTVATTASAALVVLEAIPKSRWLIFRQENLSPEETSGLYSLLCMSWLSPLLRLGNKKILDNTDLYPLDSRLSAAVQSKHFQKKWRQSEHTHGRNLIFVLFKSIAWSFLQPIPSRLAMIALSFCQPFFIGRLINFLESDPLSNQDNGLGLVMASLLIYPGLSLSHSTFLWLHSRAVSKARSGLVSAIYQKTIELSSTHLDTNILTLMSTDVERIAQGGLYPLHDIWANTVEVILASWFLHRQLGSAFIAPVLVVFASVVSTSLIAKFTGPAMSKWAQSTEARVRLTTAVVASMKALKISGLAESTTRLLQWSREEEQRVGSAYRLLVVVSITSAFTPMFLAPVATFFWALAGRQLSMAEVFSSLSYVALITSPLTQLFQKVPDILASFACLTRIQNFLDLQARSEYRKPGFSAATAEERPVAISLQEASLGWTQDRRQLKELNLAIPRSALTIVTGPVAAGKSTLCKALLGEVPFAEGSVTFHQGLPRIGYCDQTPFLINGSVRSNIVGYETFDSQLYDEVLETVILKTSRQLRLLDLEAKSPLYAQFQDTIRGIATIRAFGWVPHYTAQNYERVDDSLRPAYLLSMSQVWLALVLKLVVAFMAVSVTALATQVISLSGRAGFVGAGMVSLMELGNMMNACVHSWIHLEMSLGAVKRLKDFGEKTGSEDKGDGDLRPAESWPERGEIVIGGVDASYEEERYKDDSEDRPMVLKDVRIHIQAGEKLAIIGRTGSGKSSLILLLLRLLDPTSDTAGNIIIDGTPLRRIHRDTIRQRVIAMPQEMVFLAGGESFRTALDPYTKSTDEECQFALDQVKLWSVIQNAGGLQAEMAKDVFSQGQKQLFSLAIAIIRARLRKKHGCRGGILLLDEVTASVDRETESTMMKIIQHVFVDYTVVAVTHSLESITGFDRVIVMGNGQVIQEGIPDFFSKEHASVTN